MDVFDLSAVLRLNSSQYEQGLTDAEGKASSSGSKIKTGLGTAAKVVGVAFTAAATAVGFLTKAAVSGYGEQQQMVGGVQKLYGNMGMSVEEYANSVGKSVDDIKDEWQRLEDAQNLVLDNAREAYKTSGMSMNQYMDTATSFSAALINSLGGDTMKAAEQTDVAMRAISDNFNTFGGDIGMIKGAFQGFAKQNYTMLDNLKLGYGGTKTEMERLISDANEYAKSMGMAGDLTIDSFSDVVTAIDLVQQKQGVAGTTAREAATTIQGSMGMLQGAWENLLAGLGDADADLDSLVNNVVSSAETVLQNVMPVVETTLNGISSLLTKAAPMIINKLPELVGKVLPGLMAAATSLVTSLAAAIPGLAKSIVDAVPEIVTSISESLAENSSQLVDAAGQMMEYLWIGLTEGLPLLVNGATEIIGYLWTGITEGLPRLTEGAIQIMQTLGDGISQAIPELLPVALNALMEFSGSLRENAGQLVDAGIEMVLKIAQGLIDSLPVIIETVPTIVTNIAGIINDNAPKLIAGGITLIGNLVTGIINAAPTIIAEFPKIVKAVFSVITAVNWVSLGGKIITGIANGVKSLATSIPQTLKNIGQNAFNGLRSINWSNLGTSIINLIKSGLSSMLTAIPNTLKSIGTQAWNAFKSIDWISLGGNIIAGIASGITNGAGKIVDAAKSAASKAFNAAKNFLKIGSPSKLFRDKIGRMITEGWALGIEDGEKDVVSSINNLNDDMDADFGGVEDLDRSTTTVSVSESRDKPEYKELLSLLSGILTVMTEMDSSIDARLISAFERMKLSVNGREFGRLVRDVRTA